MKYNLTQYSQTISNTSEGNIDLSTDEIIGTINAEVVSNILIPASGTLSGTLVLDSDLGSRIHVDEVRYYFDSAAVSSTVASGIKFFYKKESFETYISLNTYYNNDYYYALVSGTEDFKYVRVEHTLVSGVSGYLQGFYVLNDDTYVDFGEDGTDTNHNVNLSVENNIIEINELQVFNSGPIRANAKLIIEPQDTVVDDVLSISNNSDGPWYGVYRDEDKVTGAGMWDTGNMDDLTVSNEVLKLLSGKTIGTYTTRIIELDEDQKLTFNIMDFDYPIVSPTVEFYDNFTYGNDYGYWTKITNPQYIYFQNGRLEMRWDNTRVRTTNTLEYTDDWEFTCRVYFTGRTDLRIYVNDSSKYVLYEIDTAWAYSANERMIFRTSAGDKYNPGNIYPTVSDQFYQTWNWIKIQKNYTTLRFKFWDTSETEPGWFKSYTIPLSEVGTTGRIDFRIGDDWEADRVYIDDVSLTKNYTASPSADSFISTDAEDTTETIEVRSSNSRPINRETYTETYKSGTNDCFIRYRWVYDGSQEKTRDTEENWGLTNEFFDFFNDSIRDDIYLVKKDVYTPGNVNLYFYILRDDGSNYVTHIYSQDYNSGCYYSTYRLTPDTTGGFWILYFLATGNVNNGDYYLRYYNSSMTLVYDRQTTAAQGKSIYDMDVVYTSAGNLWYTDHDLSTVFKMSTDGSILASYLATEDIRGILALDDGGCWFIQAEALIRLDDSGQKIDTIDLGTATASYIYSDLYDGFWLHDGNVISHLAPDGTVYFSVTIPNLYFITVIDSGVITKQHDGSTSVPPQASYVSKDHQSILRTWDYPMNEGGYHGTFDTNRYGVNSHVFDDLNGDSASGFPIEVDYNWNATEWTSVSLKDYNFTSDQYHQLRFTLRADNSANSPEVYGLWTQRAIEISNINSGNYGKFYLKSDIADLDVQDIGNYTSKIRAYWLLNTE